jgi:hypothetical protein
MGIGVLSLEFWTVCKITCFAVTGRKSDLFFFFPVEVETYARITVGTMVYS